ncbi:hypothetical protein Tco_0578576 [Tanacetum coccineum]
MGDHSGFHRSILRYLEGKKKELYAKSLMDSIEKAIAKKGLYKRVHDSRVNERTMQKHEGMISKDASKIDNNVAGASHDEDNTTESYVEIKNKEKIERFSKESKDSEKFCNDVVEVKEKLSKQIVQLEKDFAKLEAQIIDFEIALQHKTQENKSLKTLQKENENFMASL